MLYILLSHGIGFSDKDRSKGQINMLKRILISVLLFLGGAMLLFAKTKAAPYYQLQFDVGESIPSKGEMMATSNLTNDLGIILQPSARHKFIGFYELKYAGPGLRKEEGDKFSDRIMDHVFVIKNHFDWKDDYTLKSQLDHMIEYRRTGANELWGQGLYDFNRTGFMFDLNRKFSKKLSGDIYMQYHYLEFPNYTDLLAEFQAGETSETSTGKQNHHNYQLGVKTKYELVNVSLDFTILKYTKQKVIVDNVQPDRTYYSGVLQQDTMVTLGADYTKILWNSIILTPSFSFKSKISNQNYQHFMLATDTIPVRYIDNYYSYNIFDISCPITFTLSKIWAAFITPEINYKYYSNRPPRDSENAFISGNQYNNLFILSCGFSKRQNDVTTMTVFYNYQSQVSNMTFERYLLYNYSGHYMGVSFSYTY
ncbi:MAG: hypothetical protein NT145_02665 [Elusimicrobia bacterium]|nr:hypothetical protein [Elusimicrobiota bacterium]